MAAKKTSATASSAAAVVTDEAPEIKAIPAAKTKSGFGAVADLGNAHEEVKANMDKVIKSAEDFVSFGQGNVEAFVKSGQIWAAGIQNLSKTFAATAQAQMDAAVSTMKAFASVKTLKDAVELQTTLARTSVETALTESGKITEVSIKLAEEAIAPITARVTLAVETFGRAA